MRKPEHWVRPLRQLCSSTEMPTGKPRRKYVKKW